MIAICLVKLRGNRNPKPTKTISAQSASPPWFETGFDKGITPERQSRPAITTARANAKYIHRFLGVEVSFFRENRLYGAGGICERM